MFERFIYIILMLIGGEQCISNNLSDMYDNYIQLLFTYIIYIIMIYSDVFWLVMVAPSYLRPLSSHGQYRLRFQQLFGQLSEHGFVSSDRAREVSCGEFKFRTGWTARRWTAMTRHVHLGALLGAWAVSWSLGVFFFGSHDAACYFLPWRFRT